MVLPQHRVYASNKDNPNKSFADNYISSFDDLDEQTRQKFLHGKLGLYRSGKSIFLFIQQNSLFQRSMLFKEASGG